MGKARLFALAAYVSTLLTMSGVPFWAAMIGATTVFAELQDAMDRIWRAPSRPSGAGLWGLLRARLLSEPRYVALFAAAFPGGVDDLGEVGVEQGAVGQGGEAVVVGQVADAPLGVVALGDIRDDAQVAAHVAVGVAHFRDAEVGREDAAVAAPQADFVGGPHGGGGQNPGWFYSKKPATPSAASGPKR